MLLVAADRRLSAATSSKQIEQGPFSPLRAQITMPHEDETTTTTTSIVFAIQFFTNPLTSLVSFRLGRPFFPFQSIKRAETENNRMKRPPDRAAVKNKKETTGRLQQKIEDEKDEKEVKNRLWCC